MFSWQETYTRFLPRQKQAQFTHRHARRGTHNLSRTDLAFWREQPLNMIRLGGAQWTRVGLSADHGLAAADSASAGTA